MTHSAVPHAAAATGASPPTGLAFDPIARAFAGRANPLDELRADLRELATAGLTLALIRAADALEAR